MATQGLLDVFNGPSYCWSCLEVLPTGEAMLMHWHDAHQEPPTPHCACLRCSETDFDARPSSKQQRQASTDDEAHPQHYVVTPEGGKNKLAYLAEDREIWEDNLPELMAHIEAGTPNVVNGKRKWTTGGLSHPGLMSTPDGAPIISQSTGLQQRFMPFLPSTIPMEAHGWRLAYWERKAIERGNKLDNRDFVDRMSYGAQLSPKDVGKEGRRLGMSLQRYRRDMGLLPPVAKSRNDQEYMQGIETIAKLTILQGLLNTTWLPNNTSKRGPWIVVEPQYHAHYIHSNPTKTNYKGNSYIIEQAYGLSDRVRNIADWVVYLDCLAIESGLDPEGKVASGKTVREHVFSTTNVHDFVYWKACMEGA